MEPTHGNEKVVTPGTPAPAPQSTPAPADPGQSSDPAAAAPAPAPEKKVEGSPAAQKAREALDNAKKGIFPGKKDAKTKEKPETPPQAKEGEPAGKEKAAAATNEPPAPPPYVPNTKYKVGGVEKEFDESIKALIKDPETEKKVRQLYADAAGLGPLKAQLDQTVTKYQDVQKKYADVDRDLRLLSHHIANEDFDSFFADIQVPEEKIWQWVERKLELMKQPPHIQAQIERSRNANRQAFLLQEENQGFVTQAQQTAVQARTYELDTEILKPEVSQIAQEFDARVGRVGAFRDECMHRGALAWHFGKKDISAAEAVQQVMSLVGKVIAPPQAGAPALPNPAQPAAAAPAAPQPGAAGQAPVLPPPVMPNLSGSSTSPVRQAPRSVADLRQMAKTYQAAR